MPALFKPELQLLRLTDTQVQSTDLLYKKFILADKEKPNTKSKTFMLLIESCRTHNWPNVESLLRTVEEVESMDSKMSS